MDDRLRKLERQPAAADHAVRLLAERLRRGELSAARIRLASSLGDASASQVLGDDAAGPLTPLLISIGLPAVVRAGYALCLQLPEPDRRRDLGELLEAVQAWILDPGPGTRSAVVSRRDAVPWRSPAGDGTLLVLRGVARGIELDDVGATGVGGWRWPAGPTLTQALVPWATGGRDPAQAPIPRSFFPDPDE